MGRTDIVSNNSDGMRNWSSNIQSSADDYDGLINRLYSLVEGFANSKDFKDASNVFFSLIILRMKPAFLRYSTTFRDCAELINSRAANIDNNRAALNNKINSQNFFE